MTFLPVVSRELRVASRRKATYWSRALTAVAAIVVGSITYLFNAGNPPHDIGVNLFYTVSTGAFIYCLFTGVRSTSDCISEEKREGTLGLLFLTDLKGYDVVGGKLVATSLNSFYGLTAIFPILAIPLLMGGVTNGEFWRMSLVLANVFLFSLAIGMFMSSISKSPRKAMAGTLVLLLCFSAGLGLILLIPGMARWPKLAHVLEVCNPGFAPFLVFDAVYPKAFEAYWWSCGIIHASCWIFLGLASFIVPRAWQDHPSGETTLRWRDAWHRWTFGGITERRGFRGRLLNLNAFYWLAGRARLKPLHAWAALALFALIWAWGILEFGHDWAIDFWVASIVLNSILKFWVTSEAGRQLGEDRKLGALELLLSTPVSVSEIIKGQFLALRRQFLGPLLAVMLTELVFLVGFLRSSSAGPTDIPLYIAAWAAGTVILLGDLLTLAVVAMWVSLTTRNPNRTTGVTIRRVIVLPLAAFLGYFLFIGLFSLSGVPFEPGWKGILAAWFIPGLLADLFLGLGAWRRLHTEFREVAAHRFVPTSSWLRRFLGGGTQRTPPAPNPSPSPETA